MGRSLLQSVATAQTPASSLPSPAPSIFLISGTKNHTSPRWSPQLRATGYAVNRSLGGTDLHDRIVHARSCQRASPDAASEHEGDEGEGSVVVPAHAAGEIALVVDV